MSDHRPNDDEQAEGSAGDGVDLITASLSVASLRRASPLHNPTRTLRLTEAEHHSRENTPARITLESLASRPRSNPRSRTPMRYESPLDPAEFRRTDNDDDESSPVHEARRITIRPTAGRARGTFNASRINEERPSTPKSRKQGPSHRKIRRWNNDHFVGLAAEIAKSSHRGHVAAEVLLRGHEDAHLYRDVYDPKDHRSDKMTHFLEDQELKGVRERFFEGELPGPPTNTKKSSRCHSPDKQLTVEEMMHRIDPRLRSVIVRACKNSEPASRVVGLFESFVVAVFGGTTNKLADDDWWKGLLLEGPAVKKSSSSSAAATTKVQFFFESESSKGGFHRLLLHAVCQFHGLQATSRILKIDGGVEKATKVRALTVTGTIIDDSVKHRLLDHLTSSSEDR